MNKKNFKFIYVPLLITQCILGNGCGFYAGLQDIQIAGCEFASARPNYKQVTLISESGNSMKIQSMERFSTEDQIEIYLFSKRCIDDPRIGAYFTRNGEKKISLILQRIQSTRNVLGKADLLDALYYINRDCHCLKNNSDGVEALVATAKELKENRLISAEDKQMFNMSFKSLMEQMSNQQNGL